jgi:hypothetical protein
MSLDDLQNQSWTLRISRREQQVVVFSPELKLTGRASNLSEAVSDFEKKQQRFFSEMIENGLENEIPRPAVTRRREELLREWLRFWGKHFVLALFYALVLVGIGSTVGKQIGKGFSQVNKEWTNFTTENKGTDKRIERFQEDLERLKPYLRAIRKAWDESGQNEPLNQAK